MIFFLFWQVFCEKHMKDLSFYVIMKKYGESKARCDMVKITLDIDGMACGMCEAHVNDAIRRNFQVKKVTSSHSKGMTEILSEAELDGAKLKEVIEKDGYQVLDMKTEPYEKKGFSFFHRK